MAKPSGAPDQWVSVDNYIMDRQRATNARWTEPGESEAEWFKETEDHALEIQVNGVTRNSDCNVTGVLMALAEEIVQNLHRNPDGFTLKVLVNAEHR